MSFEPLPPQLRQTLEELSAFAPDEEAAKQCKLRFDAVAKPLDSLGLLEDAIVSFARLTGEIYYDFAKRAVVLFCADNGVVAQGVTQCGKEVTAAVAQNFAAHETCVCRMATLTHTDTIPVDIGMDAPKVDGVLDYRVADGTKDFTVEPAMTPAQAEAAILAGMQIAARAKKQGYRLLITGEMGIGNTTTSSACTAVLCNLPVEQVTGRGAGLSSEGLQRKIAAIQKGIDLHQPKADQPFALLCALGGLDIAGLVGLYLGGLQQKIPVLIDGLIAAVAALIACRLCPQAKYAMLATHVSSEPAGKAVLDAIGVKPFVTAGMHLGEGTGAVISLPLLDIAADICKTMNTFEENHIAAYEHLE